MLSPQVWLAQRRRNKQLDHQLPDTLMQIAAAMKSGASFGQVMSNLTFKSHGILSEEFQRVNQELREGRPQEEVLNAMAKRVGNKDLSLAVLAINVHTRSGGNLSEALQSIAERVRERVRLRDEIKTLTTQTRFSGYILTAIPLGLAVLLFFASPDYFRPLLHSQLGALLFILGGALLIVGNLIMYRMGEVEV